jgi:hypothetical protein
MTRDIIVNAQVGPGYMVPATELQRLQEHAFALAHTVRSARRMLQALDHYWDAYESEHAEMWWHAFEKWRKSFEARHADLGGTQPRLKS